MAESKNLEQFESGIAERLRPVRPNLFYRSALKARLERSKIFARRKAAGALSVLWLIAALFVVLIGETIYAAARACHKQTRATGQD
ncbi:MAG TPA: hypothetical protein PL025_04400 [Anaerolineaceae bacterium]|nr:hypothetical protein [Anaerolineaceae bacterium]